MTTSNAIRVLSSFNKENITSIKIDNTEDAIKYMQVISMLSEKLGVPPELLNTFSERAEKNLSNLDSISGIAYETFEQVSIYLIDSGREHSMSLILLGAWTEGIYIAMKYMDEAEEIDEKVIEKVIEQVSPPSIDFLINTSLLSIPLR